ncbi:hypothetical protein TTHERM_00129620 (macronuclear) [Tetrahymena thermophila SB210]|uniref:Uncharacterized protein n=1 Tax=Tetrahymena thermophila (strain SB210) TaxID=312017 RepID=I7M1E7_TETTS|nr:hypothetical protein TTHERM_00129620 [Tetrahymena thermophila SB210]EAR96185.2 hypothetical protein TTHERM_00129620 [Tetrahymena thermophila SB210]|eukprot:XP_001016430.2 hypothetical protein TTHERM_00129620 [Tetrahymena thermophila SB210]
MYQKISEDNYLNEQILSPIRVSYNIKEDNENSNFTITQIYAENQSFELDQQNKLDQDTWQLVFKKKKFEIIIPDFAPKYCKCKNTKCIIKIDPSLKFLYYSCPLFYPSQSKGCKYYNFFEYDQIMYLKLHHSNKIPNEVFDNMKIKKNQKYYIYSFDKEKGRKKEKI